MKQLCVAVFAFALVLPGWRSAAAQDLPPDVVRLRDGGMLRGTIIESSPGSHVLLTLANGETRRVEAEDVEWAGPVAEMAVHSAQTPTDLALGPSEQASSADGPRSEPERPSGPSAVLPAGDLRFPIELWTHLDREIVVHWRASEHPEMSVTIVGNIGAASTDMVGDWVEVCTVPCSASLPQGTHHLAASEGDFPRYEFPLPLTVRQPLSVEIVRVDRTTERIAGGITIGSSLVIGAFLMGIPAAIDGGLFTSGANGGSFVAGAVIGGLGLIVGLLFAGLRDYLDYLEHPFSSHDEPAR